MERCREDGANKSPKGPTKGGYARKRDGSHTIENNTGQPSTCRRFMRKALKTNLQKSDVLIVKAATFPHCFGPRTYSV
jgi:hypothetical protein